MRHLFIKLWLVCAAILTLGSCSDEAVDVDEVNKQTVLLFFPYASQITDWGYLENNLADIKSAIRSRKGMNNTKLFLFYSPDINSSYLAEITYDPSQTDSVRETKIAEYTDKSYRTTEGLASILKTVKQKGEALNYAMIIGGHAVGWTDYDDWTSYPYRAKRNGVSGTYPNSIGISFGDDPTQPTSRFFGGLIEGYDISNSTLVEAIKAADMKMQYIFFDACYMGEAEVAYELREVTNYLIASPTEVMGSGYPYHTGWQYLNSATPTYASITSAFYDYYSTHTLQPWGTLSVIDCRQMDALAAIMKEINQQYTITDNALSGVQIMDGFSPTMSYDLGNYIDSLHVDGELLSRFTTQLATTIKSKVTTEYGRSYLGVGVTSFKINDYSGITISDPSTHPAVLKGRSKCAWYQATH